MSDDNLLSRRQSLLGIGAVGTALGGGALGASSVFGGDETAGEKTNGDKQVNGDDDQDDHDDQDDETAKKAGLELEVVCHEGSEAKVRVRNKRSDEAELSWKVDIDGLDLDDLDIDDLDDLDEDDLDEDDLAKLEAFAEAKGLNIDADDLEDLEGKQIELDGTTLNLGKKTIDLEKIAEKKGIDLDQTKVDLEKFYGTVTVPKGGVESFWAAALSKDSNVELYYDGKKIESISVDTAACEKATMEDKIDLEAVCYRMRKQDTGNGAGDGGTVSPSQPGETGTYTTTLTVGSDNGGDSLNDIVADFQGTGADLSNVGTGDVTVTRNGEDVTDDLDEVTASNEGATLTLGFGGSYSLEEGDELEVTLENVQNPEDAGDYEATYTLNSQSAGETTTVDFTIGDGGGGNGGDGGDGGVEKTKEAKFRIHNHGKEDVKVGWTVNSDKQGGKCNVDAKDSTSFWVTVLDDQKTSVTVTYDGEAVDTEKADTDTACTDDCADT